MKKPYLQIEIFSALPDHQSGEGLLSRDVIQRIGRSPKRNADKAAVSRALRQMIEKGIVVRGTSGYARKRKSRDETTSNG